MKTGPISLKAIVRRLHDAEDVDSSTELWLTSLVRHAEENQPETLDALLRIKLDVARKLHYVVRP